AERERARCAAHAQSRARRARFGSLPREARQASGSVPKKCPMKAKLAEQNTRSQRGEQEEQRPGGGEGRRRRRSRRRPRNNKIPILENPSGMPRGAVKRRRPQAGFQGSPRGGLLGGSARNPPQKPREASGRHQFSKLALGAH
ncbi:unnamed protein product, partial [Prorocentrum cordatum]